MSEGFGDFYEESRLRVFRAVYVCVRDLDTADDAVSEAFTRAFVRWEKVSRHPNPVAWVTKTALNHSRSEWRHRRRRRPLAPSDEGSYLPQDPIDAKLVASVLALPERQRQVVGLRLLLDLDTEQTAEVLGIASGTVTAHLHRALSALRQQVMEEANNDGT